MGSLEGQARASGKLTMLSLPLPRSEDGLQLLCLGAHSDDLEIGCSGTLLAILRAREIAGVTWVVFSGDAERAAEAASAAKRLLGNGPEIRLLQPGFRDGFLPYVGAEVKEFFETVKQHTRPDLVFTHYRHDRHQDHRLVSELTYNTFRHHLILEYEVFKLDGDLGNPNVYVPLGRDLVDEKVALLLERFGSQRDRRWFSGEVFESVLRLRGIEAGSPSGYAEAFYGRKLMFRAE